MRLWARGLVSDRSINEITGKVRTMTNIHNLGMTDTEYAKLAAQGYVVDIALTRFLERKLKMRSLSIALKPENKQFNQDEEGFTKPKLLNHY